MRTGSLRARVTLTMLALLALVLSVVVTAVTISYRSSLDRDLRHQLRSAAEAFIHAPAGATTKVLIGNLALQGIAVEFQPGQPLPADTQSKAAFVPVKLGSDIRSRGALITLDQMLPDGTRIVLSASTDAIGHAWQRLLAIQVAVAFAALALATLLIRRVTATALQPLAQVANTATRIAGGEMSERLHPTRADTELGSMAAAFDRMVDALATALSEAKNAEDTMRRFLADASHELRTPVAALQASAETLLREQPSRPRRDHLEATLARDAARLGRLVDDLLSLARLEASQPARCEPVDLRRVTEAVVSTARRSAGGTQVCLEHHTSARVLGDPDALSRLIQNLVDNAVVAAGPAGRVEVDVTRSGGEAYVSVSDNGPGVPAADRERVFDRFVRLRPSATPGSGLGLAIARRIARQHNGDLTCDVVNHGACFKLRLPVAA
jgi:two-component system, OmpR family, sensor kinase